MAETQHFADGKARSLANLTKKGVGRPQGVPNRVTKDVRNLARALFDAAYWKRTKERLQAGRMHPAIEKVLLAYAYGEPKKTVRIEGDVSVQDKRSLLERMPDAMIAELTQGEEEPIH